MLYHKSFVAPPQVDQRNTARGDIWSTIAVEISWAVLLIVR